MSNKHEDNTIIYGTLIGSALAIGAYSIYLASKKKNESPLTNFSKTICHMVDKLECCKEGAHKAVKEVEEKIKENENVISDFFELASVGISLWKKIKKG